MISTKQDASTISYFLSEILRDGAPAPRIVVTDFCKAILIAIARVFANCADLSNYMHICYNIVNNNYFGKIPPYYIRLDVSHFIAMIARWDCLRGKALKIRQFFIRCLGHLYQINNFTEACDVIKSVLIVALSEEIGSNEENGMPLQSEIHLRNVNNIIKSVTIDDPEKDNYDEINDDYDEINIIEG